MIFNLFFLTFLFSIHTSEIKNIKDEENNSLNKKLIIDDEKQLKEIELSSKKLACMGIMKNSLANLNSTFRNYMKDKQSFFQIVMNTIVDYCIGKIKRNQIDFCLKSENENKVDDTIIEYRNLILNDEIKKNVENEIIKEKKRIKNKEIIKLHLYILAIFSGFCLLTILIMAIKKKRRENSETKQKSE